MSTSKHLLCSALQLGVLLASTASAAHSTFPTLIRSELDMPCTPACTVCHTDNVGGFGTVTEPFGKSMQSVGLLFIEPTLGPALEESLQRAIDSDGDGQSDIVELRGGQDPNGTGDLCSQAALAARYGCGASVASAPPSDAGAALCALLTTLWLGACVTRKARRRANGATRHNR